MVDIVKYKGYFIPDVYVEDKYGTAHIVVDTKSRFTYARPEYKNKVLKEFMDRFKGRAVSNKAEKEMIKKEVQKFLYECVREGIILSDQEADRIFR